MRNVRLYETLKQYCKAALTLLSAKFKGPEDLPIAIKDKFEVIESGGFSQSHVTEVEWHILIGRNEQSLKQMDVYQAAVQAMEEDKRVARHLNALVGTGECMMRVDCDMCLRSLLTQLLHEQQGIGFREVIFDRIYEGIEDYFYRDVLGYRCFSPLDRFHMETEKLELGPDFSIIRIPKEEKEEMLSQSSKLGFPLSYQAVTFNEYAFEFYVEVPKVIGDATAIPHEEFPSQVARAEFEEACSALRLFKEGSVGYNYIRMETTFWEPYGGTLTVGSTTPKPLLGSPYVLSNDEIPAFLGFWQLYRKVRQAKRNRIEIALRRFNFGYERARPEDKLVDYLIGFEALLLKQNERQELGFRLALRGSALLGTNPDERKRIFAALKTAYRERSSIVHGGTTKEVVSISGEKLRFNEFVNRVEEHLRSAVKEFLVLCEKQSELQVIKAIDERIVSGSQP